MDEKENPRYEVDKGDGLDIEPTAHAPMTVPIQAKVIFTLGTKNGEGQFAHFSPLEAVVPQAMFGTTLSEVLERLVAEYDKRGQ